VGSKVIRNISKVLRSAANRIFGAGADGNPAELEPADVRTIIQFDESVDDRVSALLAAGTNITITYNDASNTLTIASTSGGIGGSTGGTTNRVLTANGTGGGTLQACPVTIDSSGNVTGVVGLTTTGDASITGTLTFGPGDSGKARATFNLATASATNASIKPYPVASGSNVASSIAPVPKGTGASSTYKTAVGLFGTDFVADQTNYELGVIVATGTKYVFMSEKGGTGVQRHIAFDCTTNVSAHSSNANSAKQLHLDSSGMVGINNNTASIFPLDVYSANAATARFYNSAAGGANSGGGVFLNSPIATAADQRLGVFVFGSISGTSAINCATVAAYSAQAHTAGSAQGTYLGFFTVPNGSTTLTEALRLNQDQSALFAQGVTVTGTAKLGVYTVATLPSASANVYAEANVSDASAPSMGSTVAGGGAVKTKVRSNGTNWTVAGI
jgi:hypothetical protein